MATNEDAGQSKKRRCSRWQAVLRPLAAWFLLVAVLFDIKTHERLMEETRLNFSVSLNGQPAEGTSIAILGSHRIESGDEIPLGWHTLWIYNEKTEVFSRKLFTGYGPHNLGNIVLKRATGTLSVTATPTAGRLTITGPEFAVKLTDISSVSTNVPTDRYTIEARYWHFKETRQIQVKAGMAATCQFAPRLGAVRLSCNQSEASFQMADDGGQEIASGQLPAEIADVPEGIYGITAFHQRNTIKRRLVVKSNVTNEDNIVFLYGAAVLETDPPGATILTADGEQWGTTPQTLTELIAGPVHLQLRLAGYSPVSADLNIIPGQIATFQTNLVGIRYEPAMSAARRYVRDGLFDQAVASADEALQAKPNDAEAIALEREAKGKEQVKRAVAFAKRGDYITADKELTAALEFLPGDKEIGQLLDNFREKEGGQREEMRQERLNRGRKFFESILEQVKDQRLFESHELTTAMPIKDAENAIIAALRAEPAFKVVKPRSSGPETFCFEAEQELLTYLHTSAGRRKCVIVGAQIKDGDTHLLFKVLEYKAEAVNKISLGAVLGAPVQVKLVPLHGTETEPLTDKEKGQLDEGVRIVTERIQRAVGQGN